MEGVSEFDVIRMLGFWIIGAVGLFGSLGLLMGFVTWRSLRTRETTRAIELRDAVHSLEIRLVECKQQACSTQVTKDELTAAILRLESKLERHGGEWLDAVKEIHRRVDDMQKQLATCSISKGQE